MVMTARHAFVASIAVAMLVGVVPCASAVEDQRVRGGAAQTDNQQTGWDLALTGGFVMSGLVDPAYALGTVHAYHPVVVRRGHLHLRHHSIRTLNSQRGER